MTDKELLTIEVRVLLMKYGYKKLIQALSEVKSDSIEKIGEDLRKLELLKRNKSKPHTRSIDDIVSKIINDNPEKADQLCKLAARYENKTFLSQLKDVRQFLERNSVNPKTPKSRHFAASQVFRTLASLDISQLEEYLVTSGTGTDNVLSILSDQIMGKRHK